MIHQKKKSIRFTVYVACYAVGQNSCSLLNNFRLGYLITMTDAVSVTGEHCFSVLHLSALALLWLLESVTVRYMCRQYMIDEMPTHQHTTGLVYCFPKPGVNE